MEIFEESLVLPAGMVARHNNRNLRRRRVFQSPAVERAEQPSLPADERGRHVFQAVDSMSEMCSICGHTPMNRGELKQGAGGRNRTYVRSLESFCTAIVRRPL